MTTTIRPPRPRGRPRGSERLGSRTMRGPARPTPRTRAPARPSAAAAGAPTPPAPRAGGGALTAIAALGLFVLAVVTVDLRTDATADGFLVRAVRQEADELRHRHAMLQTRLEQRLFAER